MEQEQRDRALEQETARFAQDHPEVEKLTDEVAEAWARGEPLAKAWETQSARMDREDKIQQQNLETAARAPVGAVSGQGGTEKAPKDDFLNGLELDQW